MINNTKETRASLDGRDHFAFLFLSGKPYLCPSAVQKLKPSNDSAKKQMDRQVESD